MELSISGCLGVELRVIDEQPDILKFEGGIIGGCTGVFSRAEKKEEGNRYHICDCFPISRRRSGVGLPKDVHDEGYGCWLYS